MFNSHWKRVLAITITITSLLLPACGTSESQVPPSTVNDPSIPGGNAPGQQAPEPATMNYVSPLTGKPSSVPVTTRPLAVMINNAAAARPQSGLGDADLVYEVLAEGGITRLIGIFQSEAGGAKLGPIRSIRPYLIDIGESYHGILVHAGGSPDAYAIIQNEHKEELDEIGKAGPYFWRDKSRKAPHNLYTNLQKLREGANKQQFAMTDKAVPSYTFHAQDDPPQGDVAKGVEVRFLLNRYRVTYKYNATTQQYDRYIGDKPHKDKETGQILSASNVVVLGAEHKVLDDVGRLDVDLGLGGEALLFQRGRVIQARWIFKEGDMIRLVKDNQELPFYPGKTYFNIVPSDPNFESHVQVLKN